MSTTFPVDVTEARLIEFIGTIRAVSHEEIGRDPFAAPSPTDADPVAATMLLQALEGKTGAEIQAWLHDTPEAQAYREKPPDPIPVPPDPHPLPPGPGIEILTARGVDLVDPRGTRTVWRGYDMFTAIRMILDGADLTPFFEEARTYRTNLWRVFAQADQSQNGYYSLHPTEPGYAQAWGSLLDWCREDGIYLLITTYADNQVIHSGLDLWTDLANLVRPYQEGVILSGGNEADKNGWDPASLPNPGLKWWSRGTWTIDKGEKEGPPTPNGATIVEYHPRRDYPKVVDDSVASQTYIQFHYGYGVPLLIDEPPRMGDDGSGPDFANPQVCWRLARNYASGCGGAVFHARPGQKGFLLSQAPGTEACARAWFAGMDLGPAF